MLLRPAWRRYELWDYWYQRTRDRPSKHFTGNWRELRQVFQPDTEETGSPMPWGTEYRTYNPDRMIYRLCTDSQQGTPIWKEFDALGKVMAIHLKNKYPASDPKHPWADEKVNGKQDSADLPIRDYKQIGHLKHEQAFIGKLIRQIARKRFNAWAMKHAVFETSGDAPRFGCEHWRDLETEIWIQYLQHFADKQHFSLKKALDRKVIDAYRSGENRRRIAAQISYTDMGISTEKSPQDFWNPDNPDEISTAQDQVDNVSLSAKPTLTRRYRKLDPTEYATMHGPASSGQFDRRLLYHNRNGVRTFNATNTNNPGYNLAVDMQPVTVTWGIPRPTPRIVPQTQLEWLMELLSRTKVEREKLFSEIFSEKHDLNTLYINKGA